MRASVARRAAALHETSTFELMKLGDEIGPFDPESVTDLDLLETWILCDERQDHELTCIQVDRLQQTVELARNA